MARKRKAAATALTSNVLSPSSRLTATLDDARAINGLSVNGGANIFPTQGISGLFVIIFLIAVTKFLKINLRKEASIIAV